MNNKTEMKKTKDQTQIQIENIPTELYEAFEQKDIGYSLLIKGNAGVGKSTFALSLMSVFTDTEPIYISTRVAPNSVYSQFPWIAGCLKKENILDATRTYLPPIENPRELRTHILRTIRFSDAPEFLKILYDKIEKNKQKGNKTIVVIDSWDAIIGTSEKKSQDWETILTEFVRQMNVKLILVTEQNKNTFLDYIVDGIVILKDIETDERILREIEIKKIRSIERRQKRYNFTLYNNEFCYCKSYIEHRYDYYNSKSNNLQLNNGWTPIESGNNNLFSTGSSEIDKLYQGGLKTSTLNLWEIESEVPLSAFSNIMLPLLCNFISKGFGTIIYSVDGLNSRFIDKNKLFIHLNTEQISDYVRYLVEIRFNKQISRENDIRPYVVPFHIKDLEKTYTEQYTILTEKTSFKPVLSIMGYDFLTLGSSVFSTEVFNHLKFVRNYNVIEIGILNQMNRFAGYSEKKRYEKSNIEDISYFFDTHMKMIFKNNAIFVYGIKPNSGIYWLKFIQNSETPLPKISLIPMV
ncbi:MAG: RAD55 family ATPase [Promethearchaeota archaeon]